MFLTVLLAWLAVAIVVASVFCRSIHITKVRNLAGINAVFTA